jgi:peptidylprolyl isomerase
MKIIIILLVIALVFYAVQYFSNAGSSKAAEENIKKGRQFLLTNGSKEGVITTASGLQYLVLNEGSGTLKPVARDKVRVHYHGTLLDGSIFDSSVQRGEPITFALNQVIPGWTEGVQLMVVGEKTRFFIPSHLAYGKRSAGSIKPGSTLIFDVELLAINEKP